MPTPQLSPRRHDPSFGIRDGVWWYQPAGCVAPLAGPFSTLLELLADDKVHRLRNRLLPARQEPEPNANTIGQGPETLDLTKLPTIVRTITTAADRRHRASSLLHSLGWRHFCFDFGPPSVPYWASQPAQVAWLLRHTPTPFLLLEDDIAPRAFCRFVKPPIGSDFVHISGGRDGPSRGTLNAIKAGLKPKRCFQYSYLDSEPGYMRIFGMYYLAGTLVLNPTAALDLAARMDGKRCLVDYITGTNMHRYNWQCLRVPMFWQDDGHHEIDTYEYQPV